ncbi:Aromatic prenyltransferase, DMATS type [Moelleriella libera RCEF 2490]|uniref:Aromatic prenyltransferase, DMATS type n=1 Tax=Moelleriella libera RCEF 2490 TaxID=1081109 RepID=A0A167YTA9_9HYPO|nr:Aromatic prenyltransferase, DMATS type [Moelleriella libera RCEF 2490]
MSAAQLYTATQAFQKVDSDTSFCTEYDAEYWWRSSGHALAVLLEKAGYSEHAQYQLLKFVRGILPSLGRAQGGDQQNWLSFMTDDHTPIELSWDWRTGNASPKIRFSIEPIGLDAGTIVDPYNQEAAARLLDYVAQILPADRMDWLFHFRQRLTGNMDGASPEGHSSNEFYAFDLDEKEIVIKAYLFPGFVAKRRAQTNMDVISDTIRSAPLCTPAKLEALELFQDYVHDPETPPLEMDMLAIDLLSPADSRFKIYFRIRDCSFASIEKAMTLGGRLSPPGTDRGLQKMRRLYHSLLSRKARQRMDDSSAPLNRHRTAGVLYNIEFKYGSKYPKVKAYLPVRHWAENEEAIVSALNDHSHSAQTARGSSFARYNDAVRTIL